MPDNFLILDESIILPIKNVFASDSASVSESVNSLALRSFDNGTLNEFKAVALASLDYSLLTEKQSNALAVFDSGTLAEKVLSISIQDFDFSLLLESAFYQTTLSSSDSSSVGDSSGFNSDSPAQDSGSASDFSFINVQAFANDSSLLSENIVRILLSISDNFSLTESNLSNALVNLDAATLLESAFYSASINKFDSFSQDEKANIDAVASSTDSNSFFEFIDLNSAYASSDSAAFFESVINALANEDQGTFGEFISGIGLNNSDDLFLAEVGQYEAVLDSNDSSEFNESSEFVDAGLPAQDFLNLSDFALISAEFALSDSSSLLEGMPFIELSASEEGNLIEEGKIFISLSFFDSSDLAENVLISASFSVEDSAVTNEEVLIDTSLVSTEEFSLFEFLSLEASYESSDNGILSEFVNNALSNSDEGNLAESVLGISLSNEDFILLKEFVQYSAIVDSFDSSEFDETSEFVDAGLPAFDSGNVSELINLLAEALSEDSGTFIDGASSIDLSLSEDFTLSENETFISLSSVDFSDLSESAFIDSSFFVEDSFNTDENVLIDASLASIDDTFLSEFMSLNALYELSDNATLSEFVANALSNTDLINLEEAILGIALDNSDFAFFQDFAEYNAIINSSDFSEFDETFKFVDAGLPAADSGNVLESAEYLAILSSFDVLTLLEGSPSLEVLISEEFVFAENEIFIALSSLDVANLEESVFISSEYIVEDSFVAADQSFVNVSAESSEILSALDQILSLSTEASSGDESILFENVANDVFISEEFDFQELVSLVLSTFDSSLFNEESSALADLFSEDSFSIFDQLESISVDGINDSTLLQEFIDFININGIQDSSTLDEFSFIETILGASDEQYQLYEEFAFEADAPASDSGSFEDVPSIAASLEADESGSLQESIPSIEFNLFDEFYFEENIANALVSEDLSTLSEFSFAEAGIVAAEFANLLEELSVDVNVDVNDTLLFSDQAKNDAELISSDSADFYEENSGVIVSISDSASLSEFVAIEVSVEEYVQLQENTIIGLTSNDFTSFNDISSNAVSVNSEDLINAQESSGFSALLNVLDSSIVNDINRGISLSGSRDFIIFAETQANPSVLRSSEDSLFFVEISTNISFTAYELITYKEKTGIWKRAPITIDLNTDPTVHGTATGDPVIIETTGGTVPILM